MKQRAAPPHCQVPNCSRSDGVRSRADWVCSAGFRYCDDHKQGLGTHGFQGSPPHVWRRLVKAKPLKPRKSFRELNDLAQYGIDLK